MVLIMNRIAINIHSENPKIWSVEMPNAPYSNRSGTFATSFISAWNHKNPAGLRGMAYKPFSGVKVNGNILNKGRTGLPLAYRKPSRYRKRPSMFTEGERRFAMERLRFQFFNRLSA